MGREGLSARQGGGGLPFGIPRTVLNGEPRTPGGARRMRKSKLRKSGRALSGTLSARRRRWWPRYGKRSGTTAFHLASGSRFSAIERVPDYRHWSQEEP